VTGPAASDTPLTLAKGVDNRIDNQLGAVGRRR
jgi:hypothetical protein